MPHDSGQHWFQLPAAGLNSGGVKGHMVKVAVRQSYRDQNLSMAEFWIKELVSINGEAVQ